MTIRFTLNSYYFQSLSCKNMTVTQTSIMTSENSNFGPYPEDVFTRKLRQVSASWPAQAPHLSIMDQNELLFHRNVIS